jgi:ankyrin repeat protein
VVMIPLENGADINATTKKRQTLLHWACCREDPLVVKILLEKGADVNALSKCGKSPLWFAFSFDNENVVVRLPYHTKIL